MEVKEIQRLLSEDADPAISTVKKLMKYFSATCPNLERG